MCSFHVNNLYTSIISHLSLLSFRDVMPIFFSLALWLDNCTSWTVVVDLLLLSGLFPRLLCLLCTGLRHQRRRERRSRFRRPLFPVPGQWAPVRRQFWRVSVDQWLPDRRSARSHQQTISTRCQQAANYQVRCSGGLRSSTGPRSVCRGTAAGRSGSLDSRNGLSARCHQPRRVYSK